MADFAMPYLGTLAGYDPFIIDDDCVQMHDEMRREEHMLEMLKSEKQDLENEVCRFRVTKAKLLQQIAYVIIIFILLL